MRMDMEQLWNKRVKTFYIEIAKYYSVIIMSVFYSLLFFGSVFVYYYIQLIQWIPSHLPTEWLASIITAMVFLHSSIRTFIKKADAIYILPAEEQLSRYFVKTLIYSGIIHLLKISIVMAIISPLISNTLFKLPFLVLFLGLIILNVYLTCVEQWLTSNLERFLHKLILFLSYTLILYFLYTGNWAFAIVLLLLNYGFTFYVFPLKAKRLNWDYLIKQEEKSLSRTYKFINIYMDVPHLKRTFRKRLILSRLIHKLTSHNQADLFLYLFALLFIRYNDFYYLYIRLTIIGVILVSVFPAFSWIPIVIILFMTGYQILPLQREQNDTVFLYPVLDSDKRKSFLKLISILLVIQLIVMNIPIFFYSSVSNMLFNLFLGLLFVFWFVQFFSSKRLKNL